MCFFCERILQPNEKNHKEDIRQNTHATYIAVFFPFFPLHHTKCPETIIGFLDFVLISGRILDFFALLHPKVIFFCTPSSDERKSEIIETFDETAKCEMVTGGLNLRWSGCERCEFGSFSNTGNGVVCKRSCIFFRSRNDPRMSRKFIWAK